MDEQLKAQIDALLTEQETAPVAITLDWLSVYFKQTGHFAESYTEGDIINISPDCYLLEINRPTLHFNTHFVLFYKKEECGHVLLNTKNEMFFAKDVVKVEFSNHTLYSQQWQEVYTLLQSYGLRYSAAGRIDIAIDGVNYLRDLLNIYAKQTPETRTIILKNSTAKRAMFHAKVLNPTNLQFENFNIGGKSGNKMITVYNKSLEIVKSGKNYIQEWWKRNGIIQKLNDLEILHNELLKAERKGYEVYALPGLKNIYRFELRLWSESVKEIKDFKIEMLFTAKGLANIVKTHCSKFFDTCFADNRNVSKCTSFQPLPYNRLEAKIIAKIQRQKRDGIYKAKLTIHGLIQDIYKGYIGQYSYNEVIETITDRITRYRLHQYLTDRLPGWSKKYTPLAGDRINEVTILINHLQQLTGTGENESADLAGRHGQAGATANFGE